MRRCPNEWQVLRVFFTKYQNRCWPSSEPVEEQSILWVQYSRDSAWSAKETLRFISKEEALKRLREIHPSPFGVCKVVGLNSLVR